LLVHGDERLHLVGRILVVIGQERRERSRPAAEIELLPDHLRELELLNALRRHVDDAAEPREPHRPRERRPGDEPAADDEARVRPGQDARGTDRCFGCRAEAHAGGSTA